MPTIDLSISHPAIVEISKGGFVYGSIVQYIA